LLGYVEGRGKTIKVEVKTCGTPGKPAMLTRGGGAEEEKNKAAWWI
jgi:hypothetical protein